MHTHWDPFSTLQYHIHHIQWNALLHTQHHQSRLLDSASSIQTHNSSMLHYVELYWAYRLHKLIHYQLNQLAPILYESIETYMKMCKYSKSMWPRAVIENIFLNAFYSEHCISIILSVYSISPSHRLYVSTTQSLCVQLWMFLLSNCI